jgi:peptidoglycan/xylan/chitin deacetylase (PgdA/CDA1 family)
MISRSIKEALGQSMHFSSGTVFLRSLSGRGLRILAYHRVCDTWFDPLSMCLSPELFERNLRHIRAQYLPLTLEEGLYLLREGKKLPEKAVALTFDDGYADNLSTALPLLKHYGIPATVFINVNAVENKDGIWHDRIAEACRKSIRTRLDLRGAGLERYNFSGFARKMSVCRRLVGVCQRVPDRERERLVEAIVREMTGEEPGSCRLMLDWEGVKYLASNGVAIGSHGMNHSPLRTLIPQDAEYEIRESKRIIRERTGIDVQYFANPFGNPRDFREDIVTILKNNGYTAAFVLWRGVNTDSGAFTLGRYCITPGMVTGFGGRYSPAVFDLQMALPYGLPVQAVGEAVQPA